MTVFDNDNDHDEPLVRRYHSEVNRTILFVSMVSFATVFFLVFVLYLYARCVLRGRSRHRAAIRRLTIAALHVSDLDAAAAHRHAQPPSAGLDPAITESLPTFTVGAKLLKGSGGGGGSTECAVCLSALEDEDKAKLLPNCNHFFHVDCIDTWLNSHSTCPLCRAEVTPRLKPHDREAPVVLTLDDAPIPVDDDSDSHSEDDDNKGESSLKNNDSNSRLNSFRRILIRERSSRRILPFRHDDEDGGVHQDLERQ